MHPRRRFLAPLAALPLCLAAPALLADDDDGDKRARKQREQAEARAALQRGDILPLPRILEHAQRAVPGDVIEVELERKDRGYRYEVKVLTARGLVHEIKLDAKTGAVLSIEDD
mgnify:CR=1 FL=1